jgi:hypothetical protein
MIPKAMGLKLNLYLKDLQQCDSQKIFQLDCYRLIEKCNKVEIVIKQIDQHKETHLIFSHAGGQEV